MAEAEKKEPKAKKEKVLLSPEERRQRVVDARASRVESVFKGRTFEYVGEVHLGEGDRYTDVTGNKGRHGHSIKVLTVAKGASEDGPKVGELVTVGPSSLKKLADEYKGIKLPEKPKRESKKEAVPVPS